MKTFGTLLLTISIGWQVVPHEVAHIRCLKLISQDDFDRARWVTRDGKRDDIAEATCHRMRFTRWMGLEWLIPDNDWVLPVTTGGSTDDDA